MLRRARRGPEGSSGHPPRHQTRSNVPSSGSARRSPTASSALHAVFRRASSSITVETSTPVTSVSAIEHREQRVACAAGDVEQAIASQTGLEGATLHGARPGVVIMSAGQRVVRRRQRVVRKLGMVGRWVGHAQPSPRLSSPRTTESIWITRCPRAQPQALTARVSSCRDTRYVMYRYRGGRRPGARPQTRSSCTERACAPCSIAATPRSRDIARRSRGASGSPTAR